jgi:protease IV
MGPDQSQIWTSVLHSILSVAGSLLGIVFLLLFLNIISNSLSRFSRVKRTFNLSILPNADGEKQRVSKTSPVILQMNLTGIIGGELLNLERIETQLVEARMGELSEGRVKGIFLHFDSPGGAAKDCDAIYRRLKAYKEKHKIPIYAYADGLCASGGYLIACAADKIYTSPTSIIGSVGVRLGWPFFNVHKVLEKWEIGVRTYAKGKFKDHLNPFRPWQEEEDADLKEVLSASYDRFVEIVVKERSKIPKEKLIEEYGARIYSAKDSEALSFIDDGSSDYANALFALLAAAGIDKEKPYQVVELVKKRPWIRELMEKSPHFTGKVHHQLQLSPHLDPALHGRIAYLYQQL